MFHCWLKSLVAGYWRKRYLACWWIALCRNWASSPSLSQLGIVADGIEIQVTEANLARARQVLASDYSGELENE